MLYQNNPKTSFINIFPSLIQVAHLVSFFVKNDQAHIFHDIDQLDEAGLSNYFDNLNQVDLRLLSGLYQTFIVEKKTPNHFQDDYLTEVKQFISLEKQNQQLFNSLQDLGLETIAKGEVAIILLCGGQGTRLGIDKPKGMLKLDIPSGKTIFEYYAEKIKSLCRYAFLKYPQFAKGKDSEGNERICIQFYLMTSVITNSNTKNYFKENNNFGICEENIHYFVQGYLPSLDQNGKIILENKNQIFLSPNGSGGLYQSLESAGVLKKLNQQNIKYIQVTGVDNILVKLGDPKEIGIMASSGKDIISKYAKKRNAQEQVGIFILNDGRFSLMEYSEMTENQKNKLNESGQLAYNKSFLCNLTFSIDFLNRIYKDEESKKQFLQYHLAHKKIAYYDLKEQKILNPKENNAYKFELFIHDSFPLAKSFILLEVPREEQFAPIKNSVKGSQNDNPRTAIDQLAKLHQKWLQNAGYTFDYEASWEKMVEVDPSLSFSGENIPSPDPCNGHITTYPFYLK